MLFLSSEDTQTLICSDFSFSSNVHLVAKSPFLQKRQAAKAWIIQLSAKINSLKSHTIPIYRRQETNVTQPTSGREALPPSLKSCLLPFSSKFDLQHKSYFHDLNNFCLVSLKQKVWIILRLSQLTHSDTTVLSGDFADTLGFGDLLDGAADVLRFGSGGLAPSNPSPCRCHTRQDL